MKGTLSVVFSFCMLIYVVNCSGVLYPRESETREVKSLNGIWQFLVDDAGGAGHGFRERWYHKSLSNEVACYWQ